MCAKSVAILALYESMDSQEQVNLLKELMQTSKNKKAIAETKTMKPKVSRKQKVLEMALLLNKAA